jgi:cytochrome c oxidase subunit 4
MLLLVVTILAAQFNLGRASLAVALAIAVAKAVLIVLFFMQARYGSREVLVFAGAAYLWLAIMLVGTLFDYATRNWLPGP